MCSDWRSLIFTTRLQERRNLLPRWRTVVRLRQSLRLLVPVPVEPRGSLRVALSNSKKALIVRDELYIYIYNSLYRKIKIVQRQAYSTTSYRYSLQCQCTDAWYQSLQTASLFASFFSFCLISHDLYERVTVCLRHVENTCTYVIN